MRVFQEDKGSVIIAVTIAMMVFLGVVALAVDSAHLYYRQVQLQDISDASALAAGKGYEVSQTEAINKAIEYAGKNGLTVTASDPDGHTATIQTANGETGYMDVTFPDGNVKVVMKIGYNNFFARVFADDSSDVGVYSVVGTGILNSFGLGLVPIGVVDNTFTPEVQYEISYGPGSGYDGNYGFVNLDSYLPPEDSGDNPAGDNNFVQYLADGYTGETIFQIGGTIDTITGVRVGQIRPNLPTGRIVTLPLIDTLLDAHGVERVTIVGFAEFRIDSYGNDRVITGTFIRRIDEGPSSPGSSEHAVQAVRLLE
jgi:Flp pilus assembly protein TadG